jgi:hypothetical protein
MGKPYMATGGKPTFHEVITPIGLIVHLYHDKPQLKTKDQFGNVPDIDPKTGIQLAEYKVTLAWSKQRMNELQPIIDLAQRVKAEGWPESVPTPQNPQPFFALEPFFRDGDNPAHNTKGRDYLKGRYYLNFKSKATGVKDQMGQVIYTGAPGLLGPGGPEHVIFPTDIYPGCTGRVSGIIFATEYMGKHFISTRLNNIQLYESPDTNSELQRIGGGARPTAASQFGALTAAPQGLPSLGGGQPLGQFGFGAQAAPQQPYVPPQGPVII